MKRQKTQRTERYYSRQDGVIFVQDVTRGAGNTQPALPRPALPGEITHLRAMLLFDIRTGERSQAEYSKLFATQED